MDEERRKGGHFGASLPVQPILFAHSLSIDSYIQLIAGKWIIGDGCYLHWNPVTYAWAKRDCHTTYVGTLLLPDELR